MTGRLKQGRPPGLDSRLDPISAGLRVRPCFRADGGKLRRTTGGYLPLDRSPDEESMIHITVTLLDRWCGAVGLRQISNNWPRCITVSICLPPVHVVYSGLVIIIIAQRSVLPS